MKTAIAGLKIACVAGVSLTVAAMISGATQADTVTLRYGVIANSARSISSLPLYTAQRKGFLAAEGIALESVPLAGTEAMVEASEKGLVDITSTATPYLIQAGLKGYATVAVIGGIANNIYSLLARPEIKSFEALKGKTIGMSQPNDTITLSTRLLLTRHGLKESDYASKVLVGTPVRSKCLSDGDCAATPLGQPDDILFAQKGFNKLGDSLEVIPVLQFNVLAARRDWAQAHKNTMVHLARAFAVTYRFMGDPTNRHEVAAIMAETTGASADVAAKILAFYYDPDRGVMPKAGEISMPGMAKVIELLGESGEIAKPLPAPDRFVDLTYLKAAGVQ
jgi:ABC-type nitrate/sulfonate/bicarbonate transport system substrate-binding protein